MTRGDYARYLRLDVMLAAQHPMVPVSSTRSWADEHFFIVAHQACELWLKQLVLDLRLATRSLDSGGELAGAVEALSRAVAVQRLLTQSLTVLTCLTPKAFAEFRPYLLGISGAQSAQWAKLQTELGVDGGDSESPVLRALRVAIAGSGTTLVEIMRAGPQAGPLHRVVELVTDLAEGYIDLELAHLATARRLIGEAPGTGGTSGTAYLTERLRNSVMPELWAARTAVHQPHQPIVPA